MRQAAQRADALKERPDTSVEMLRECAAAIWRESGPAAVSFGAVAERAGVAKSLTAYHFKTTDALRAAAAQALLDRCASEIEAIFDDLADLPRATGPRIWVWATGHVLQSPNPSGLVILEIASLAMGSQLYRNRLMRFLARLRRAARSLAPEYRPRDFRTATAFVAGTVTTLVARRHGPHHLAGYEVLTQKAFDWDDLPPCAVPASNPDHDQPQAGDTRGQIILAAIRLLAKNPVGVFSHRLLAREAKSSLSSTTYYFTSKDAILEAVVEHVVAEALEAVAVGARVGPRADARDINRMIASASDFYLDQGVMATKAHFNLGLYAARTPSMAKAMDEFYRIQIENFRRLLGAGSEWASNDNVEFLYPLISGHLLLCLLGM